MLMLFKENTSRDNRFRYDNIVPILQIECEFFLYNVWINFLIVRVLWNVYFMMQGRRHRGEGRGRPPPLSFATTTKRKKERGKRRKEKEKRKNEKKRVTISAALFQNCPHLMRGAHPPSDTPYFNYTFLLVNETKSMHQIASLVLHFFKMFPSY